MVFDGVLPRESASFAGQAAICRPLACQSTPEPVAGPIFSPYSFRVLVVIDLLSQDVPLEDVQYLAGHANPRTTQIYDRRRRRVRRNIVERISV